MIRSLLNESEIPSYCQHEQLNQLYGGIAIPGLNDAIIEVFDTDKYAAIEVIKRYLHDTSQGAATTPNDRVRVLPELL
jgi:hypothetical protein